MALTLDTVRTVAYAPHRMTPSRRHRRWLLRSAAVLAAGVAALTLAAPTLAASWVGPDPGRHVTTTAG